MKESNIVEIDCTCGNHFKVKPIILEVEKVVYVQQTIPSPYPFGIPITAIDIRGGSYTPPPFPPGTIITNQQDIGPDGKVYGGHSSGVTNFGTMWLADKTG